MNSTYNYLLAQATEKATEYGLLAPLPMVTVADGSATSTFATYIPGLFNLIIGVAGVLAVVMIIYGGIKYMSTDAFGGKSEAKEMIENAIWGLILAISAWLILFTIYPDKERNPFVNFNLDIEKQDLGDPLNKPELTPFTPLTPEQLNSYNEIRKELVTHNIIPYAGVCDAGITTGCVNLDGLQRSTIDGIKALATFCASASDGDYFKSPCGTITITGGTEGGHSTNSLHGQGRALDFRGNDKLNLVITGLGNRLTPCQTYTNPNFPGRFLWEPSGQTCGGSVKSSSDHWHVSY